MSCLDWKKLLPHRKVWKLLTNKLPLKLIRSKALTNKWKNPSRKTTYKKLGSASLSMQPKKFKKRPNSHARKKNRHRCFQKAGSPVFVDHLFVEPISELMNPPQGGAIKEKSSSSDSSSSKKSESSKEIDDQSMVSADDVWESMVLASPQMHEINERADEFIARFRAQMNHQEMLARRF